MVGVLTAATSCATAMPFASSLLQDAGVVDQVTEDRQWAGVGVLERERDGIANAEAHAEVGRSKDTHGTPRIASNLRRVLTEM